jgi:hypothetical protein
MKRTSAMSVAANLRAVARTLVAGLLAVAAAGASAGNPADEAAALLRSNARNASQPGDKYGVILSRMPSAVGSPSYSGTMTWFDSSARLTFWREVVDAKTRLFVRVDSLTGGSISPQYFFCPGGSSFSILQNGQDYGEAFAVNPGDGSSFCAHLATPTIFLVDQWPTSVGPNFDESGAFELTAAPTYATSITGRVSVGAGASTVTPPPPVFPMTVTSNITPTTANATAVIQFRDQDVGTSGSVFTFAVAPTSIVKGGLDAKAMVVGYAKGHDKDAPYVACVLSQLGGNGQLVAVTAEQLQAYLSGSLSAQGASVTILGNVATPAVAGATFYVGYGSSASSMITNGVYRGAVTVPGSGVCPMLSSQTSLWWNASEPGWGLNLNHQGNKLFGTLFTYDASRAPLWLVMPAGALQSDGLTFTGDLYRTTGPAFDANPFTPIGPSNLTKVGTMTVAFVDVNTGTLSYTVNNVQVGKGIQRQVFGSRAASCLPSTASRASSTNYQDLWWNPAESGWGINVTHQDNTLFATLFTYDAGGRTLWLVMSNGVRQSDGSYLGDLFRTTGPVFNATPFTGVTVSTVGTMRLRFSDGNNGTLTYTYNGATVTKSITRQLFDSPVPLCN